MRIAGVQEAFPFFKGYQSRWDMSRRWSIARNAPTSLFGSTRPCPMLLYYDDDCSLKHYCAILMQVYYYYKNGTVHGRLLLERPPQETPKDPTDTHRDIHEPH